MNDWIAHWLTASLQDLKQAARSLRRSPAFTIAAALTLVIGIASIVAMFTVVNGVLLRPLPFGSPDRLVSAWHDLPPLGMEHQPQTASTYFTYQRLARSIDGIGVYRDAELNVAEPGCRIISPAKKVLEM